MSSLSPAAFAFALAACLGALASCYWPYWATVEEAEDECFNICDRVDDCTALRFDSSDCINDCIDRVNDDFDFADAVDDCGNCMGNTCGDVVDCGFECDQIVDVTIIDGDVIILE